MKLFGNISALITLFLLICSNAFSLEVYKKTTINNTECYIYEVQPGEGFFSIDKKFGVSRDELVKFNPEIKNGLKKGQTLYIPTSKNSVNEEVGTNSKPISHIVQAGETLYSISKKYEVSINDIKSSNDLYSNSIKVGQVLSIGSNKPENKKAIEEKVETTYETISQDEDEILTEEPVQQKIPENKVVIDGVTYNTEKYVVKRKETLYSISQKFNTTIDAIIACNPNLKSISKDDILNIPMTKDVLNIVNEYEAENKHVIINNNPEGYSSEAINVAVVFPFKINTLGAQSPYADYYKGLLLALDSLRNNGMVANLYTYDTYGNIDSLKNILQKTEIKSVNIIFGSDKNEEIKLLGEFAKENKIYLVNSFSVKNRDFEYNPYIIQGHIPSSLFFSSACNHFVETNIDKEIIFLYDNLEPNDKIEFTEAICNELKLREREFKKFSFNDITDYEVLNESLGGNSDIILVASSSTKIGVAKTCAIATRIKESNPSINVSIFGYPEWQTYFKDYMDTFHNLNTTIFTRFYSQPTKDNWKDFNKKFRYWFGNEKSSIIPTPNILGFDTGLYLIYGLLRHNNNFEQYLETIESHSIQTDFSFTRLSNVSGLVNTNLYFVTFTPEYKIVKEKVK